MILTCPRCATRYLIDPVDVWATGRTVQCEACGQRWREVGEGVPPAEPEPPTEQEPAALVDPPEVEAQPQDESSTAAKVPESSDLHEEATQVEVEAVETAPAPDPGTSAVRPDWYAAPAPEPAPEPTPDQEPPLTREFLFRTAPERLTASFASPRPGAARWLAVVFLVMIVLAAAVMFRDVIVHAFPALAPIYASMGLLVHPAVVPHG
jgi:predicted Zn finger-like uncharacterized protein